MNDAAPIADADQRDRALDPQNSFIVQAPAGSGKTELLTQRYLRLLACVNAPEEVVAITFTNKAAGEMAERVLKALQRGRDDTPPESSHERTTWDLARAVIARDAEHGWDIEANPRRLRIQTIDSLCGALTRQMPLVSRLGAAPAINEHPQPLYLEAARNTLAELEADRQWSAPIAKLLEHLDNALPRVEELVAAMLAKRDQWLRHVADPENPRLSREQLEAALEHLVTDALANLSQVMPRDDAGEIVTLLRYAGANLAQSKPAHPIAACAELDTIPGSNAADLETWQAVAELLLTQANGWRKSANANLGFPARSGTKDPEEQQRRDNQKQRLAELIARLCEVPGLTEALADARELPPVRYSPAQWELVEALVQLLPMAAAQLRLVFREHGEVDFTEVAQSAVRALGEPQAPTDLTLSLDYRIRHLLVDEFQDTSLSQYELLRRLTAGWQPDDGRTFFAVGDPMQSIYRFREAEVGLFLNARHAGLGDVRLESLRLSVNFRSQAGIVEWVNDAFAKVLPTEEDIAAGAVPFAPSKAIHAAGRGDAVVVHPQASASRANEAQQVVALINEARAENPEGRVAILVRSRTHVADIVAALKQAGVRFQAVDIERLTGRQAVQDLYALTRALLHPADRAAWLAVLRAPWCGLSLADLHQLAASERDAAVWNLVNDPTLTATLSPDGQKRLARMRGVLGSAIDERRRRSLRRWVEGVWLALGGPATVADPVDIEDALVYLKLIEGLEEAGDLESFATLEEQLGELYALPDTGAGDAVQVMTVHKAKGLEFDTVIVPGLGRSPRSDDTRLLRWLERPHANHTDLLLAPVRAVGGEDDTIYKYLSKLDAQRGRHEDGRLLYVAATRAIRRLHLLGHTTLKNGDDGVTAQDPAGRSLLSVLWPAVQHTFRQYAESVDPATLEGDSDNGQPNYMGVQELERLTENWSLPAALQTVTWQRIGGELPETTKEAVEFEWAGEAAAHAGTVVHATLLRIAREGADKWNKQRVDGLRGHFRAHLARLGVPETELDDATDRVCAAIEQTLADERGRWILDPSHPGAHSEYALSGLDGTLLVNVTLDRTFVDADGVRWIVDYKVGAHTGGDVEEFLDREQERYKNQLDRYGRLMRQMDDRPVRLGLYFPLLRGWREWAAGR